jgi:cytochrome c556
MKQIILFIAALSFAPGLLAQDFNPEMVIKYRKDFMTAIKGHNNDVKAIVNGVVPFDNHLDLHLDALDKLFAQVDSLFPEGSDFGETNAKEAIWENPEKFAQTVKKAQQALADFKKVAADGDMTKTRAAFKNYGRASCGGCHKSYKKKQN